MNLRLTDRDLALMRWINGLGFVTIDLIATYLNIAKPTAYGRIKKLVVRGYLLHERIFHGVSGIYRASAIGAKASNSPLPPLRHVRINSYHHDLKVAALSLCLCGRFGGQYIPERDLLQEKGLERIGQLGHVCDGILVVEDKRIAIEVELHKKGKRRREQIMQAYLKNFDYQEVWYFCGNAEVERQMTAFTKTAFGSYAKGHRQSCYRNQEHRRKRNWASLRYFTRRSDSFAYVCSKSVVSYIFVYNPWRFQRMQKPSVN